MCLIAWLFACLCAITCVLAPRTPAIGRSVPPTGWRVVPLRPRVCGDVYGARGIQQGTTRAAATSPHRACLRG